MRVDLERMGLVYHVYKTDCLAASRVRMQQRWHSNVCYVHLINPVGERPAGVSEMPFGFGSVARIAREAGASATVVFHTGSALPYLIVFVALILLKRLMGKGVPAVVYDLHDLHERIADMGPDQRLRYFRYNVVRYYLLLVCEWFTLRVLKVPSIAVSYGMADIVARTYGCERPGVVFNVSLDAPPSRPSMPASRAGLDPEADCVFFGTTERLPIAFLPLFREQQLKLHFYGRGPGIDALIAAWPDVMVYHGPFRPDDLDFLNRHRFLVLLSESNTPNFRISMPNKVMQAVGYGLSILCTDNFDEIVRNFQVLPGALRIWSGDESLGAALNALAAAASNDYLEQAQRLVAGFEEQSRRQYLEYLA